MPFDDSHPDDKSLSVTREEATRICRIQADGADRDITSDPHHPLESASSDGKYELLIRTDAPAPGLAQLLAMGMGDDSCVDTPSGMTLVLVRLFFYGDGAGEAMVGPAGEWAATIAGLFPPPAPPAEHHE